jgi:hypothetical protein
MVVVLHRSDFFGTSSRGMSKTYAAWVYGLFCIAPCATSIGAQTIANGPSNTSCASILSDSVTGVHLTDSARTVSNIAASTNRSDTASFAVGGARNGAADIVLLVGVHADEVRFAKQPNVRVRLCWGGDTVRVVQRDNLPSPVVAGTTYRNVYVAVELVGRVNAECLSNILGVGNGSRANPPAGANGAASTSATVATNQSAGNSAGSCAFLGGSAGAGAQTPRPPKP